MNGSIQNQSSQSTPVTGADNIGVDSGFPDSAPQASPSDFFPPPPPNSSSMPKNKVIATFLGMLLLVGGLGVGIVLVEQPQLLGQKAATLVSYACSATECDTLAYSCSANGGTCTGTSPNCTCNYSKPVLPSPTPVTVIPCFLPGTKVQTPDGDKNIEDIATNTNVYSFNDQTENVNISKVSDIHRFQRDYYFDITSGTTKVSATAEHPFYVGGGKFVEASKLKVGDTVYLLNNGQLVTNPVTSVQRVNKQTDVYNLTVAGDHTYFANNYAVHNKTIKADPAPTPAPPTNLPVKVTYSPIGDPKKPDGGTVTVDVKGFSESQGGAGWSVFSIKVVQDTTNYINSTNYLADEAPAPIIPNFNCTNCGGDKNNDGIVKTIVVTLRSPGYGSEYVSYTIPYTGTTTGDFTATKK